MRPRPLEQTGLEVSPVGFGSFKIGRNTATKYPAPYDCPSPASSRQALRRDTLDLVLIHAHSNELGIVTQTDVVETLLEARQREEIRCCELSAKTVTAARQARDCADVLMLEYHPDDRRFEPITAEADARGRGVVIKKALASGHLPADTAIRFVLQQAGVDSVVVGSLKLDHMRQNVAFAGV